MLWENFLIELLTRIGKTRITKKRISKIVRKIDSFRKNHDIRKNFIIVFVPSQFNSFLYLCLSPVQSFRKVLLTP